MTEEEYQELLRERERKYLAIPAGVSEAPTDDEVVEPEGKLSEYDLESSASYDEVVLPYMAARYGTDRLQTKSKADIVSMFMNNMRGFGNNTLITGKELSWLAGADDEEKAIAGAAYSFVNDDMANLYSKDTTLQEKASGTWDYVRQAVLDPINIVGGVVGKAAGGASFRLGYAAARKAAIAEFRKQVAKGATEEAAKKAATKVYTKSATEAAEAAGKEVLKRRGTKGVVSNLLSKPGMREVAASTAVDMAAGALTDYGYQRGLMKVGSQDEYNELQTFLSGVTSLASGAISAVTVGSRGVSDLELATGVLKPEPPTTEGIGKELKESIKLLTKHSKPWDKLVTEGKKLDELDLDSWTELLRGNEEYGWKGLAQIFAERNLVYNPDYLDETFENKTDWIADKIINMPKDEKVDFIEAFKDITGITQTSDGRDVTVETFAEVLAAKASELGQGLSFIRQIGRTVGKSDITESNLNEYAKELGLIRTREDSSFLRNLSRETADAQTNLIRGIVSNLGTTALNVRGWGLATTMNSVSDLVQANILATMGNTRAASHLIAMQRQKALNLIDNNTTLEAFQDYLRARPKVAAAMSREISGGVGQQLDIDFDVSFGNQKITEVVDGAQAVNLVYAQDTWTKAQEFMYQLDKQIRLNYDMSYSDFLRQSDAFEQMNTDMFRKLELKAVDEVERAVFSRSFKDSPMALKQFATVIEDVRQVPGFGLLAPFGKFFNNTISNMSDHLGITLTYRAFTNRAQTKGSQEFFNRRTEGELLARTVATWTAIGLMVPKEIENVQNGLGVFEDLDNETGEVVTKQYDFPLSYMKAIARWRAKSQLDMDLTNEEMTLIGDTLGFDQFTRQLQQTGNSARGLWDSLVGVENAAPISDAIEDTLLGTSGMLTSGITRTFEPVNAAVGLALGEDYVNIDRKQGVRLINENLKYIDQIVAAMSGKPLAPEKYSAVGGTRDVDVGKFAGSRSIKFTAGRQMLNYAGIRDWTVEGRTKVAEADNEFNRVFHTMFEYNAQRMLASKKFKEGDRRTKELFARQVVNEAKRNAIEYITRGLSAAGRPELGMMYKIMSTDRVKVQESMQILTEKRGYPENIEDYTVEQLHTLEALKRSLDDFRLQGGMKQ